jgi:hypothetical protein
MNAKKENLRVEALVNLDTKYRRAVTFALRPLHPSYLSATGEGREKAPNFAENETTISGLSSP